MTDQPNVPPPPPETPPGGADADGGGGGEPSKPWWKKKWGIAVIAVVAIGMIGALTDDDEPEDSDPVAAESEPEDEEAEPEPEPEPEPTEEAEPEPQPEPEPEYKMTEDDVRTAVFPLVFDSAREGTMGIIEDLYEVESVDSYDYDPESGTVEMSTTAAFDFDEGVRDDAWKIMRIFGGLYEDQWVEPETGWAPTLDLSVSSARYRCDGDTMQALADARLSRDQWEEACREA